MQVKPPFFNRFLFRLGVQLRIPILQIATIPQPRSIKRVGYEGRDRTESERRKIKNTRRKNFRFPRREAGITGTKNGNQGVNFEFVQRVPALVKLESRLLPSGGNVRFGDGFRVLSGGGLLGGFRGSGEHLNDLFERGGIGLDEGGRVRIDGFGSSDGLGRVQLQLRRWRHELDSIAGAATAAAAVCHAAAGRREERRRVFVVIGRGFH